jgi:transcription termination factor Rho
MAVLDQAALEASPLADLHAIASELSIDGFRRLRREPLIEAIIERQGGAAVKKPTRTRSTRTTAAKSPPKRASKSTPKAKPAEAEPDAPDAPDAERDVEADGDGGPRRRSRSRTRSRPRAGEEASSERADEKPAEEKPTDGKSGDEDEPIVEGVVELLPNGSGFVRVSPPDPSDNDVYVSAAQVKRCELVSGDRIAGPRRAPRRSERFASLVRVDTINGAPASELADGARFDELPAAFPSDRFKLGSEDPTVKAIEWLTPIGRGSRVTIVGGARAGKTEALRKLAAALGTHEDLQLSVVLAGVRPEEIPLWNDGPTKPAAAVSFAASADSQDHTVELVIDQARRIAARGAHAVVLIDTLEGMHPHAARRAIAAARNLVDGGSLTVIATASQPLGGETTVISLDAALTSTGRFPSIDLAGSGTIKPELLVGEAGAEAIAKARAEALLD